VLLLAQKWKRQGDASCDHESYDVALAAYEEALSLDPENPYFYHAWGNTLVHLGRFEEAIAAYDTAIELKPDFGLAYKGKGDALNAFAPFVSKKRREFCPLDKLHTSVPYLYGPFLLRFS